MDGVKSNIAKWATIIWMGFLTYLVLGGILGFILMELGYVGPFCNDPPIGNSATYEKCKPCGLYGSIFDIIEIGNCDNFLLKVLAVVFISVPRLFVILVAMLLYGFVEPLASLSKNLPAIFFIVIIASLGAYLIYSTLYKNKKRLRFLHRTLLLILLSLGAQLALAF